MATSEKALKKIDALIVSAFGRGHWLATHLAEQGWGVTLIDVSNALGSWEPVDWDGPFGLFETENLSTTQKTHWLEGSSSEQTGLNFWFKEGPMEGVGQLAGFQASEHGLSTGARAYLHALNDSADMALKRERRMLMKKPFNESWICHLVHQLGANVYAENDRALNVAQGMPFFSPYYLRDWTAGAHTQSLQRCREAGVSVVVDAEITDVMFSGHELGGVLSKFSGGFSGVQVDNERELRAEVGVWMLASFESEIAARSVRGKIYPKVLQPEWSWLRFTITLQENAVTEVLPSSFVYTDDVFQSWTHENLLILRRSPEAAKNNRKKWNVWARVPSQFRFDSEYLGKIQKNIISALEKRLKLADPQELSLPIEAKTAADSVASRWPVFLPRKLKIHKTHSARGFFVDGPEQWLGLDPLSRFQSQRRVLKRLDNIQRVWNERVAKLQAKIARGANP